MTLITDSTFDLRTANAGTGIKKQEQNLHNYLMSLPLPVTQTPNGHSNPATTASISTDNNQQIGLDIDYYRGIVYIPVYDRAAATSEANDRLCSQRIYCATICIILIIMFILELVKMIQM